MRECPFTNEIALEMESVDRLLKKKIYKTIIEVQAPHSRAMGRGIDVLTLHASRGVANRMLGL